MRRMVTVAIALIFMVVLSGRLIGERSSSSLPVPRATVSATVVAAAPTEISTAVAETHLITGTLLIQPGYHYETQEDNGCTDNCGTDGSACNGISEYDDLQEGTHVVVRDAANQIVAIGELKTGTLEIRKEAFFWGRCRLPLVVTNVPDATFYTITIGSRSGITYSHEQLVAMNWTIALSVGEPDW